MAFTGATNPLVGTNSLGTLTRDIHAGVLEALKRPSVIFNTIYKQSGTGGTGLRFVIEGKEDKDDVNVATYAGGTQVNVTDGTQDELVINFDRPQYVARRVDGWDEAVTNWGVMEMQGRQIQSKLLNTIDRKAVAAIESATTTVGLVGNGSGTVVVNPAIVAAGATPQEIGDALAESIFAAVAAVRANDDFGDLFIAVSPKNYSYLVQSTRATNADFTNGNGGFDAGTAYQIGGATLIQTNNFPATASLEALVYGAQAAGAAILWDLKTRIIDDDQFLDAKRIQSYFSNGMRSLRAESAAAIKSA